MFDFSVLLSGIFLFSDISHEDRHFSKKVRVSVLRHSSSVVGDPCDGKEMGKKVVPHCAPRRLRNFCALVLSGSSHFYIPSGIDKYVFK